MARPQLMTEHLPIACFVLNSKFETIDCNRAAVETFLCDDSIPYKEARALLIARAKYIYPGYESHMEYTEQVIAGACKQSLDEGYFRYDYTFITFAGELRPFEVTIVPFVQAGERGYICYLRDLHVNQHIKDEIIKRNAAEAENDAKSRFLARMCHEFRGPIHTVLGIVDTLKQEKALSGDTQEALRRIHTSSQWLASTLDDLIDLTKMEAGKLEIENKPYQVAHLIIDTVQQNQVYRTNKKLLFSLTVDKNLPASLCGDELRIRQLLGKILSNAFKYTQVGMVTLAISGATGQDGAPVIRFAVKDTGQGMTNEQKARLYDSIFARFQTQENSQIMGFGLGLCVAMQLIRLMDGEISIESAPNRGTEVVVSIPQRMAGGRTLGAELAKELQNPADHDAIAARLASEGKPSAAEDAAMPCRRVLVVDDVETNLYIAQSILENFELQVDLAFNGKEALEKIEAGEVYDIIFMDYLMPEMDGIEATQAIRALGYAHPIIVLTANNVTKGEKSFAESGFDGFLSKPIDIVQLERYLNRFIHEKNTAPAMFERSPKASDRPVVLIIDDSLKATAVLNDMLRHDYRVLTAKNGTIGLAVLEKQKVNLVLLDIAMPGMSGFEVLTRIKERGYHVPVVFITVSDYPEDRIKGMMLGAVDFLRKPYNRENVLNRVKMHIKLST